MVKSLDMGARAPALAHLILSAFPFDTAIAPVPDISPLEWPALAQAANDHGLAPLLYASLKKRDALNALPPEIAQELRRAYLRTCTANWLAFRELNSLLELFGREHIPVIVLKGAALATTLYPDAGLRPLGDLDLLFRREDVTRVGKLLVAQGFEPNLETARDFQIQFANEQCFVRRGNRTAQVDVHWHLLGLPYYRERIPIEWFWQRTRKIRINDREIQVLAPEAQLLHLSAHFALHHQAMRLKWSYDLALLLAQYREQMNWDKVITAVEEFGLSQTLQTTLKAVLDSWDVAAPAEVVQRLSAVRPSLAERVLFRACSATHTDLRVLADGLSVQGWRARLGFYTANFFPSPTYMRQRYNVPHAWLLPAYYLWRLGRGLCKGVLSAVSMLRVTAKAKG